MTEYIYRGFKISYKIITTEIEQNLNLYKADGTVTYLLSRPKSFLPVKFHTEYDTYAGAEHEIKKLLENYVDFELKNFYDMEKEKAR
ncbi:hypothetical protein [Legionella nagasakiensis]|uniref:hypothetical protein n=1 Tax=Legionella nagasakiensis TaxID=535290 RepID=UPI0010565370|nr:hypothetical protein [Legionella nagasakiensis]